MGLDDGSVFDLERRVLSSGGIIADRRCSPTSPYVKVSTPSGRWRCIGAAAFDAALALASLVITTGAGQILIFISVWRSW